MRQGWTCLHTCTESAGHEILKKDRCIFIKVRINLCTRYNKFIYFTNIIHE